MKSNLFVTMFVVIVALISCSKDNDLQTIQDSTSISPVTFTLINDDGVQTRANGANRYIMEVYSDQAATKAVNCFGTNFDTHRAVQSKGSFKVALDKEVDYTILFWSDNGEGETNATYNADNLKEVALMDGKAMTDNAYFARVTGKVAVDNNISLRRAVAKIQYKQKGVYIDNIEKTITVTYATNYTFNCLDSLATETATPVVGSERKFTTTSMAIADGATLGTDYTFATAAKGKKTLIKITIQLETETDTKTIPHIEVQANKVTNIMGQYSSNAQESSFTISPDNEWDEPSIEKPVL